MVTTSQRPMGEASVNLPGSVMQRNASQATHTSAPGKQIVRRKVVEVEPEPRHARSEEAVPALELFVSASCDFSRYRCRTSAIRFKDTMMFQTRVYEVAVTNKGRHFFRAILKEIKFITNP